MSVVNWTYVGSHTKNIDHRTGYLACGISRARRQCDIHRSSDLGGDSARPYQCFRATVLVLLTLPFTILTLGLFLLILNAGMLNLAGWFVDGFEVVGFWSAVFGAIVVSLASGLCSNFIGPKGSYEVLVVRRES